nr:hypothetical protein [Thermoleophilaceae bacterium]
RRPDVPCETQEPPNLSAPGGPLSRFTDAGDRGKLPRLKSLTSRQAALRKAAQGYGKYERTVLAKRKKRFDRALQKLARDAKR